MKIILLFTHLHVIPNQFNLFIPSHKWRTFVIINVFCIMVKEEMLLSSKIGNNHNKSDMKVS